MKKFLFFIVIALSLVGVAALTYAAMNQTSTKSSASSCTTPPKMVMESTSKYDTMTIYHLKLINNCSNAEKFAIKVSSLPNSPKKHNDWAWKFKDGEWNKPLTTEPLTGTSDISLTIQQPLNDSGLPKEIEKGIYQYFEVETKLENGRSGKDLLNLTYSVN